MLLSMNWIRDFVDLSGIDLDDLIRKFTLGTAEVEEVFHPGEEIRQVVVGEILSVEEHPNSKKLHVLKVGAGDGEVFQVVCGAPNVRAGMKVPFCKLGGTAGGMTIEKRELAGVMSEGMCCSQKELGISDDHAGLWELPASAPVGADIKSLYEIDDTVFEVDNKSLTNRPDLWGHYGIAREMAALSHRPLRPFEKADLSAFESLPAIPVSIEDPELCYRYSALAVENITVPVSPVNMQIRLYRCGMRGINLLADLTNYLMLELGQPMHAFDYQRVSKIEVGHFEQETPFQTLDGKERLVSPETLMIKSGGVPVAVAGIMGGLESEIVDSTHSFLLESANFDAVSVRKSSQALGLRTDASMRYEKTLDPEMTLDAIARYVYLLTSIDPKVEVISSLSDSYVKHYPKREITFDKAYIDRMTGIDIPAEQMEKTLTDLGFGLQKEGELYRVEVPSFRATKDVTIKADILEEITRIYGYDNFSIETAKVALHPIAQTPLHRLDGQVKDLLVEGFGSHEVHTYLWNDGRRLQELGLPNEGVLHLTNSVSPDIDTLRMELIPALLCIALKNKGYQPSYSLFEIASVVPFLKEDSLAAEERHLGVLFEGRKGEEEQLLAKAKRVAASIDEHLLGAGFSYEVSAKEEARPWMHPYNAFRIQKEEKCVGSIALVHPSVAGNIEKKTAIAALELNLSALYETKGVFKAFEEPSRFPAITNDTTYIVPKDLSFGAFENVLRANPEENLVDSELVGIYENEATPDQKSVTIRLTFCSSERTLESEEVLLSVDRIREAMARELGAVVEGVSQ